MSSELIGAELDAAVARALGCDPVRIANGPAGGPLCFARGPVGSDEPTWKSEVPFMPSQDWSDGGPIIERERILVCAYCHEDEYSYDENGDNPQLIAPSRWWAAMPGTDHYDGFGEGWVEVCVGSRKGAVWEHTGIGPTPLIAAMRAFVASKA